MTISHLTAVKFDQLVTAAGLDGAKSIAACRRVLVDGVSINQAAREQKVAPSTVSRMLRKIPRSVCPACGQPVELETRDNITWTRKT